MASMARLTAGKLVLAALAAGLALAACSQAPSAQSPPEPGDKAAARVNGQVIWVSDVKREAVAEGLIGPGDPLDVSSDLFRQVLDEVIDTRVLAAEAARRGLDKDPAGQRRLASARDRALEDLLVDNVVGKAVTPATENGLYQEFLRTALPPKRSACARSCWPPSPRPSRSRSCWPAARRSRPWPWSARRTTPPASRAATLAR